MLGIGKCDIRIISYELIDLLRKLDLTWDSNNGIPSRKSYI